MMFLSVSPKFLNMNAFHLRRIDKEAASGAPWTSTSRNRRGAASMHVTRYQTTSTTYLPSWMKYMSQSLNTGRHLPNPSSVQNSWIWMGEDALVILTLVSLRTVVER